MMKSKFKFEKRRNVCVANEPSAITAIMLSSNLANESIVSTLLSIYCPKDLSLIFETKLLFSLLMLFSPQNKGY